MSDWGHALVGAILGVLAVLALVVWRMPRMPLPRANAARRMQNQAAEAEGGLAPLQSRQEELATTAGMLAELLSQHLWTRFLHLLLIYPNAQSLQTRLSQLNSEYAPISFFYFCKLISLLARCESQGKPMFTLSSQAERDGAQRLINGFLASIPQGEQDEGGSIDTFEIVRHFSADYMPDTQARDHRSGTAILPVGDFVRRVAPPKREYLPTEFEGYERWLMLAPPGLVVATEALEAFCHLLRQERDGEVEAYARRSSAGPPVAPTCDGLLRGRLSPVGMEKILSQGALPRPIGVFLRKSDRTPRETEQVRDESSEGMPEKTAPAGSSGGGLTQIQADTVIIQR